MVHVALDNVVHVAVMVHVVVERAPEIALDLGYLDLYVAWHLDVAAPAVVIAPVRRLVVGHVLPLALDAGFVAAGPAAAAAGDEEGDQRQEPSALARSGGLHEVLPLLEGPTRVNEVVLVLFSLAGRAEPQAPLLQRDHDARAAAALRAARQLAAHGARPRQLLLVELAGLLAAHGPVVVVHGLLLREEADPLRGLLRQELAALVAGQPVGHRARACLRAGHLKRPAAGQPRAFEKLLVAPLRDHVAAALHALRVAVHVDARLLDRLKVPLRAHAVGKVDRGNILTGIDFVEVSLILQPRKHRGAGHECREAGDRGEDLRHAVSFAVLHEAKSRRLRVSAFAAPVREATVIHIGRVGIRNVE
mmetsp:Transcript_64968/g.184315  ORF Transcript_64968/g.184315 Transcript_64968/m.184315 type:complete len:362 (+) Transcript_64968:378-1463(+)